MTFPNIFINCVACISWNMEAPPEPPADIPTDAPTAPAVLMLTTNDTTVDTTTVVACACCTRAEERPAEQLLAETPPVPEKYVPTGQLMQPL